MVTGWQLHTISKDVNVIKELMPDIKFTVNKTMVMTGTVVDEPTGRWKPGNHMRTSVIVSIKEDMIETLNTRYQVIGPEGDPALGFNDLGPTVMRLYY